MMLKRNCILVILAVIFAGLCGCEYSVDLNFSQKTEPKAVNEIRVHYIDVGQGDSTFIELSDGKSMLIDAGNPGDDEIIEEYIDDLGYDYIDYVIATHPHSDHIGGMAEILDNFDIGKMYMPSQVHTSKTFENLVDTIKDEEIKLHRAEQGKVILQDGMLKAEILSPENKQYDNLNNSSVVVKLIYGESEFLFMGDAEKEIESKILKSGYDVEADVLKVGHHGSSTSSSEKFIHNVSPQIAVISCGENNEYGHPHHEVMSLLEEMDITICRTDEDKTVIITADANENFTVN